MLKVITKENLAPLHLFMVNRCFQTILLRNNLSAFGDTVKSAGPKSHKLVLFAVCRLVR